MNSSYQWILVTAGVAVFDVSRDADGMQLVRHVGLITILFLVADALWALWGVLHWAQASHASKA